MFILQIKALRQNLLAVVLQDKELSVTEAWLWCKSIVQVDLCQLGLEVKEKVETQTLAYRDDEAGELVTDL